MEESKTTYNTRYQIKLEEFSFLEKKYGFNLYSYNMNGVRDDGHIFYLNKSRNIEVKMWHDDELITYCNVAGNISSFFKKDFFNINLREECEIISNGLIKPDNFKGYLQRIQITKRWNELNLKINDYTKLSEYTDVESEFYIDFEENKANDTVLYIELLKMYLDNIEK